MNEKPTLQIGTSRIVIDTRIISENNRYYISRVLEDFCRKKLTTYEYIKRIQKYVMDKKFFIHDKKNGVFIIPISFLDQLKEYLTDNYIEYCIYEESIYATRHISFDMDNFETKNELQDNAISWISNIDKSKCGLELQTGCLSGDTNIGFNRAHNGFGDTIRSAYYKYNNISPDNGNNWDKNILTKVRSYKNNRINLHNIIGITYSGIKPVYKLTLEDNNTIEGTFDHPIMTNNGYIKLGECVEKLVMCDTPILTYIKAISVEYVGEKDTYDIQCEHPHNNFVANGIVVHNSGKTICAIRAIYNIKKPAMIIMNGLVDQWCREFKTHTNIGKNIYVIQGFPSIKTLLNSDLRPDVLICSLSTIREYIKQEGNYADIIPYSEFIKKYEIGIKIVDEAHLCFHASCMIDLSGDVPHNIYLTATFDTANSSVKRIFYTYFPDHIKYGGEIYDKYVDGYFYSFLGRIPGYRCMTPKGYSHGKYEEYMLKNDSILLDWLDRILRPLVNMHYINRKECSDKKLLIFCNRIDMIECVVQFLKDYYPDKNVVRYIYEDSDENLSNGDIIVSTHKGAGTGTDIKNLAAVINTISFKASTTSKQVIGRLRKLKDGTTPEYVDIYDCNIAAHIRHYRERSFIIKNLVKQYKEFRI